MSVNTHQSKTNCDLTYLRTGDFVRPKGTRTIEDTIGNINAMVITISIHGIDPGQSTAAGTGVECDFMVGVNVVYRDALRSEAEVGATSI